MPVSTARLLVAYEVSAYSKRSDGAADLARDLASVIGSKVDRQWVGGLLHPSESVREVHASRRRGLSRLLNVSEIQLAGEDVSLSLVSVARLNGPFFPLMSVGLKLAFEGLLGSCANACKRDLDRLLISPREEVEGDAMDPSELIRFDVHNYLASAVWALAYWPSWRSSLLQSTVLEIPLSPEQRQQMQERAWTPLVPHALTEQDEEESRELLGTFSRLLDPWFSDEQCLNYRRLRETFIGIRGGAATMAPNSSAPRAVHRRSGARVSLADRFTPLALVPARVDFDRGDAIIVWKRGDDEMREPTPLVVESENVSLRSVSAAENRATRTET